ncbi:MAG: non-hydrolyzing UDP-N-acetylglucosamine 2-epimerase [Bacteroidota bacterium]
MDSGNWVKRADTRRIKAIAVFGTRPEAIKMAPLLTALSQSVFFQVKSVATGQHRRILNQVLSVFGIKPDYDLKIMTRGQSLVEITNRVLKGLTPIIKRESPDLIIVQGDTTTTFASCLAAFYSGVKVAHIEAGLRTGNKQHPFPEEANRVLTTHLADWHFAPTSEAKANLIRENVSVESIFVTGNTVIDALFQCLVGQTLHPRFAGKDQLILVTAHRRENWGEPLERIVSALKGILKDNPRAEMMIPVHPNPRVRKVFYRQLAGDPRVHLLEPFDYREMVAALSTAYLIITDSGGIQEEAAALGKPVLVLRETTERPEGAKTGAIKLVGTQPELIISEATRLLQDQTAYRTMAQKVHLYGDGKAAARIVSGLLYIFGLAQSRPADFEPVTNL